LSVYDPFLKYGLKRTINAATSLTTLGDSIPDPRVYETMLEADAVDHLTLHLRVAEPVPCLEDEYLDHHYGVQVWSAALGSLVIKEVLDDGSELFPVDVFLGFG
jgi:hypothetical protein